MNDTNLLDTDRLAALEDAVARLRAVVALVYPDDLTPAGKRMFDSAFEAIDADYDADTADAERLRWARRVERDAAIDDRFLHLIADPELRDLLTGRRDRCRALVEASRVGEVK